MNNNINPYTELYDVIKGATKTEASFFIAKVINPLPNLTISFEGIELDKDSFMISKSLLNENSLVVGSEVILFKPNSNTFVVVSEVVNI